jgi:hypothetical protein
VAEIANTFSQFQDWDWPADLGESIPSNLQTRCQAEQQSSLLSKLKSGFWPYFLQTDLSINYCWRTKWGTPKRQEALNA